MIIVHLSSICDMPVLTFSFQLPMTFYPSAIEIKIQVENKSNIAENERLWNLTHPLVRIGIFPDSDKPRLNLGNLTVGCLKCSNLVLFWCWILNISFDFSKITTKTSMLRTLVCIYEYLVLCICIVQGHASFTQKLLDVY